MTPAITRGPIGRRIGFFNNKGGVGKTRVTVLLAAALAEKGRRVLVVDMDPQGNATRRLAVADVDVAVTIGEALQTRAKGGASTAIYPCGWDVDQAPLIDVIPADLSLTRRDEEAQLPGSFNRLAKVLYGVTDDYDFTLFDCRPTLGHLEQMVVRCLETDGDGYYLVVQPGADAIGGAYRVTQEVASWADDMDVTAPPLGVIVNMYDDRLRLHRGRASSLEASITMPATTPDRPGPPILRPFIPQAVHLAELDDQAQPPIGDKRLIAEGITAKVAALAAAIDR